MFLRFVFAFVLCFCKSLIADEQVDLFWSPERWLGDFLEFSGKVRSLDYLESFFEKPIALKRATLEDLSNLPGLSVEEASEILRLAKEEKVGLNLKDVLRNARLNWRQKTLLRSVLVIEPPAKKIEFRYRIRNKLFYPLPKGIKQKKFLGSALDLYQRADLEYGSYSLAFLADKDLGEKGADAYYIGSLAWKGESGKIIFGDFGLQWGLGNFYWRPWSLRKSSDVLSQLIREGKGPYQYRSSIDGRYFRGIAAKKSFSLGGGSKFETTFWSAKTNRSGSLDSLGEKIVSVYESGYFRTASEIARKNAVAELNSGGTLAFKSGGFSFEGLLNKIEYDKPINSASSRAFSGKSGWWKSAVFRRLGENFSANAEASWDAKSNFAFQAGAEIDVFDFLSGFGFRYADADYRAPFGGVFGERSYLSNERGVYLAARKSLGDNWGFRAFADFFNSLRASETTPFLIDGFEIFVELEKDFSDGSVFLFRARNENKALGSKSGESYRENKLNARLDFEKVLPGGFLLKLRAEAKLFAKTGGSAETKTGILFFAQATKEIDKIGLFGTRIYYFDCDDYDAAIWQAEYWLPGAFYVNPLYGAGSRANAWLERYFFDGKFKFRIFVLYRALNRVNSLNSGNLKIFDNESWTMAAQFDVKI